MKQRGFVGSLFDLSFSSFVTTKIIRVLYVLSLVGVVLAAGMVLLGSVTGGVLGLASDEGGAGVIAMLGGFVMAALVLFFGVLLARIYMELLIVVFRIAESTEIIAQNTAGQTTSIGQEPSGPPLTDEPSGGASVS